MARCTAAVARADRDDVISSAVRMALLSRDLVRMHTRPYVHARTHATGHVSIGSHHRPMVCYDL